MILVADSGSSKADWILSLPDAQKLAFKTQGINPYFLSEKDISRILLDVPEIQPYFDKIKEVYFFGAGCSSPDKHELVSNALSAVFKTAFISVDNDVTGSAYATCGKYKGLTCILGTGSNISFFDGQEIHPSKHGLGFILGDEGSGTYFGKKLLTSFFYDKMPPALHKSFYNTYRLNKETVIQQVYMRPSPNTYLASFARFMSNHKDDAFIQAMLYDGFDLFVKSHILTYPQYTEYVCHFVGSIAFHFKETLKEVCKKNGVQPGKIIKQPIDDLFKFIMERESK